MCFRTPSDKAEGLVNALTVKHAGSLKRWSGVQEFVVETVLVEPHTQARLQYSGDSGCVTTHIIIDQ